MMTDANSLLAVQGITVSVDEKPILRGIDLTVGAGETHVVMGPNSDPLPHGSLLPQQ